MLAFPYDGICNVGGAGMIQIGSTVQSPYQRVRVSFWLIQGEFQQEFAASREETHESLGSIEELTGEAIQELEIRLARWIALGGMFDLDKGCIDLDDTWGFSTKPVA
ncbi:hypothetical protein LCGC14_1907040 [marine sediment metagenome]|uniref:Uncharacterized protein n=1 Tax=marine sediment metagenome TaxID=412755 RepID=A0A0F9GI17_9ZZZZ